MQGIRHRGFTLIVDRGFYWASEDANFSRRMVCRDVTPWEEVKGKFIERVDRELDSK